MKLIQVKNGDFVAAINELIECKRNGEFAVIEIGESLYNTTDDVPTDFVNMSREAIITSIQQAASKRRFELRAAKLGLDVNNPVEAVIQYDYDKEHRGKGF